MKAAPTLEGGLRIDAEEKVDWSILSLICVDASNMPGSPLADQLSQLESPNPLSENQDWQEYVLPDLRDTFSSQISQVAEQIKNTVRDTQGRGSLIITPKQIDIWYGTLNQARLALEAEHKITSKEPEELQAQERSALYRYEFYSQVQSWLLSVMV